MKKILLSILGIFLGLSVFCSADYYSVGGFSCDSRGSSDGLTYFCNSGSLIYHITGLFFSLRSTETMFYSIYDITNNLLLESGSIQLGYCKSNNFIPTDFEILPDSCVSFTGIHSTNFYPVLSYNFNSISDGNITNDLTFYSPKKNFFGLFYEIELPPTPKFTVNYGNQSKEYEITSDVDIFINSPVVKNGSTFTFDGSTGINLVYNGGYNWYEKNKLYLNGQFRFTQGVFTPICL